VSLRWVLLHGMYYCHVSLVSLPEHLVSLSLFVAPPSSSGGSGGDGDGVLTWSVPSRLFSPPYTFPGRRLAICIFFSALAGHPGSNILEGGGSAANHAACIFCSSMLITVVLLSSVLASTPLSLSLSSVPG